MLRWMKFIATVLVVAVLVVAMLALALPAFAEGAAATPQTGSSQKPAAATGEAKKSPIEVVTFQYQDNTVPGNVGASVVRGEIAVRNGGTEAVPDAVLVLRFANQGGVEQWSRRINLGKLDAGELWRSDFFFYNTNYEVLRGKAIVTHDKLEVAFEAQPYGTAPTTNTATPDYENTPVVKGTDPTYSRGVPTAVTEPTYTSTPAAANSAIQYTIAAPSDPLNTPAGYSTITDKPTLNNYQEQPKTQTPPGY
jgi:hypothetical protein